MAQNENAEDTTYLSIIRGQQNTIASLSKNVEDMQTANTIWCEKFGRLGKTTAYLLVAVCWVCGFFFCEWGVVLTPFIVAVYYFHNNKKYKYISYILTAIPNPRKRDVQYAMQIISKISLMFVLII